MLSLFELGRTTAAFAAPSLSIGNTTVVTGTSGVVNALFPESLSAASTSVVTVAFATFNGSATAGIDYTATSGVLTIPAGSTTGNIGVPVAGGQTDSSGLTLNVTTSNPVNATIAAGSAFATIIHDTPPTVASLSPTALSSPINTSELLTATYQSGGGILTAVSLNIGNLSSPETSMYAKYVPSTGLFYLANASGTYIGGYPASSSNSISTTLGTLNLAATTVSDNGNELVISWDFTPTAGLIGAQNVYLIASDALGLSSGWQNSGTWTVTPITTSINSPSVVTPPSGTQYALFTVSVNSPPPAAVVVNFATANGTARAGTDYTSASGTLTIPVGSTTGTISVPVAGGQTDASGLTFTVTLASPVNTLLGTAVGTATIIHDVAPTLVSVTPDPASGLVSTAQVLTTTYSSVEGASNFSSMGLSIGNLSSPATSIYAKYVPSTNLIYLANANGTYIGGFAPGSNNVISTGLGSLYLGATTVTTSGNQMVIAWDFTPTASLVGTEGVYLIAGDNLGLSSGWQKLGTWTVSAAAASINNLAVFVGPSGTAQAQFTVFVSPLQAVPVTLSYATVDGTALAGRDYIATNGTLTIPAESFSANFLVTVLGGQTGASDSTFSVLLSNPVNVYIQSGTGNATIVHDAVPTNAGVAPNPAISTVDAPEVLTTTWSSPGGSYNFSSVGINIGNLSSPANSLYAKYVPASQLFYLANASGTYIGGYTIGSEITISTALGTLNLAGTTVTRSGNQLVIGWDITPASGLLGTQNVYMIASDLYGLSSNWQNLGVWNVTATPSNDNFASAQAISGASGSVNGTTAGSTIEPGEPNSSGENQSVWFQYTAPSGSPGRCQITVTSSGPNLAVTAFSGSSLTALTQLSAGTGAANFATISSAVYYIQVAGENDTAPFALTWSWVSGPPNDAFAYAQPISGVSGSVNGTTVGATAQAGEPNPHSSKPLVATVWYQYVAPASSSGAAIFSISNNVDYDYISTYTGTVLTNLTQLDSQETSVLLTTEPGVIYDIQIETNSYLTGSFTLGWNWAPAPANDNFANAQVVTGASGSVPGTTLGASYETFEAEQGVQQSVWYSFTAPSGSPAKLSFWLTGYASTQYVTAFTGPSTNLVQIAAASNTISFVPVAGQTYSVQIANFNLTPSAFNFNWLWTEAPPNDNMASAQSVSGISGIVNGTTVSSTLESGEPNPNNVTNSVWYDYSAPSWAAGSATLTLSNNAQNQVMEVYYSPNTTSNTPLGGGSGLTFATVAGGTYLIQVGAMTSNSGTFSLGWAWAGPPQNDNFANAQVLTAQTGQVNGTTVDATLEAGDPTPSPSPGTVWYEFTNSWTAGTLNFTLSNQSQSDTIGVYTGSSLGTLVSAGNTGGVGITTTLGATYYVEIAGGTGTGSFTLNWVEIPINDAFANAISLSGTSGQITGTTVGATVQTGEPQGYSSPNTVWYEFTAPSSGPGGLSIEVNFANTTHSAALYQGTSLANLTLVGQGQTGASCPTTPGATYYVQVFPDGNPYSFTLDWSWLAAPANDNFANAQAISGATGSITGATDWATLQSGEPAPPAGGTNTVWYLYTAPSSSSGEITFADNSNQYVSVYEGTALANLASLGQSNSSETVPTSAGASYYVAVSGPEPGNSFTLSWSWSVIPPNDNFANAQPISGASSSVNGTTSGSTLETGEPNPIGMTGTVWYVYTAPLGSSGAVSFSGPAYISTYQGTSVSSLTQVGYPGQAFILAAGAKLYVQVGTSSAQGAGPFTLTWTWVNSPANDDFVNAQPVSGASGSVSGTTFAATPETGEPNVTSSPLTVWYAYTAPSSSPGYVNFTATNVLQELNLYALTGTSVSALTPVANAASPLGFSTTPGSTYYIQAASPTQSWSTFDLGWTWSAAPANDNFANAQVISGASGSVTGTNIGAGPEVGEPSTSGGSQTVWYKYTAPSKTGTMTFTVTNSASGQGVEVYSGSSLTSLVNLAGNYDAAAFTYTSGATYYVQVIADPPSSFTLSWASNPTPSNDNIANATAISGGSGTVNGTTIGATLEPGEPINGVPGTNHTVWYVYTAPTGPGYMTVTAGTQNYAVYPGTPGKLGTPTISGYVSTTSGADYYIQVESYFEQTSAFALTWSWWPQNDAFENAQFISGTSGSVVGSDVQATIEAGEPDT